MTTRIWKIEALPHPHVAHAADAVEIHQGEPVRRVTLSAADYEVYKAYEKHKATYAMAPHAAEMMASVSLSPKEVEAALVRLTLAEIIPPTPALRLQ